jgi:predicted transcriptional regulator
LSKVSESVIQNVYAHLTINGASTVRDVAETLGVHRVTAGDALRELLNREMAVRTKARNGDVGQSPYVYEAVGSTLTLTIDDTESDETTTFTPGLVYRKGTVAARVAAYVARQDVNTRFTVGAVHKQLNRVGDGNVKRSAVLMGVKKLVDAGCVKKLDVERHNSDGSHEPYYLVLCKVPRPKNASVRKSKSVTKTKSGANSDRFAVLEAQVAQLSNELNSFRQGLASLVK